MHEDITVFCFCFSSDMNGFPQEGKKVDVKKTINDTREISKRKKIKD